MCSDQHGQAQLQTLLERDGINWTGSAWDKGEKPSALAASSPLRALAAREEAVIAQELASPIGGDGIAVMLYRLQGHYWQQGMSEQLAREVARDYLRLLDGYPEGIWQSTCDAMLLDPERKFFPKVGELKQLLETQLAARRWRLRKLRALLGSKDQQTA